MLLRGNDKEKVDNGAPEDSLPRLVLWSGRTEEAVNHVFHYLAQSPLDAELIGLMHSTQNDSYWNNTFRGYGILKHDEEEGKNAICIAKDVVGNIEKNQSIVWVFPGVGSQWRQMGKSFMEIPVIKNSIENCHKLLAVKGIDLLDIITSDDPEIFDNIVNTFVGTVAIQIGMVDALKLLGIEPDYIIGHSIGEIVCAYADGCFTAEQTILTAYNRGLAFRQGEMIDGAMAAIGMSANALESIIPEDIDIACHNSQNSCTIAGPANSVKSFVAELKSRKVFAKEVNSSGVPAHSRYVKKAVTQFHSQLANLIPKPIQRSSKWLSTSVQKSEWNTRDAKYSSPEYHSNNLANTVLFHETSTYLPSNSLMIEIGPHELLQSLLKQNLPSGVHIGLAKRYNDDNVAYFLNALGK
jgi:fatty acid synthase